MKCSVNEAMFYCGIILTAAFTAGALFCFFFMKVKWTRLSEKLDNEYGKEIKNR